MLRAPWSRNTLPESLEDYPLQQSASLLREVVQDGSGVVAGELDGREVLERVEPLQAVEEELVEHLVALDHGKVGKALVITLADAVGGSSDTKVEQAACTSRMLGSARCATRNMKHLTLQHEQSPADPEWCCCGERGGNVAGIPIALVKDPVSVIGWKRNLPQHNHHTVVACNGHNISTSHRLIPKDQFSISLDSATPNASNLTILISGSAVFSKRRRQND